MNLHNGVNLVKKNVNPAPIIEKIIGKQTDKNIDGLKKAITEEYKKLNLIDKNDTIKGIDLALNDDETNELLKPLMRKTEFYLARHEFKQDKEKDIFYNELKQTIQKVKKFLESSGMIVKE
jgi:hypothetical protein